MLKIRVRIDNRIARFVRPYPHDELLPYWSYAFAGARYSPVFQSGMRKLKRLEEEYGRKLTPAEKSKANIWDGRIKLLKYDTIPAGLFRATYQQIEKDLGVRFIRKAKLDKIDFWNRPKLVSTGEWSFQNECLERMLTASVHGGGLVLNATGSGKTRLAAMYFAQMKGSGLFIVDQLNLLKQAKKDISKQMGEKVGIVGMSLFRPRRITVATRQTLAAHRRDLKFMAWLEELDAEFIDEIHEQMNKSNFDLVEQYRPPVVFGLTATLQLKKKPIRLKAWSLTGPVVYEYPLQRGMSEGVLSRGIVTRIILPNPILTPTNSARGRQIEYTGMVVDNKTRNSVISRLARYADEHNYYTIILVDRVKHLKRLSDRLPDVPHKIVAGTFKGEHIKIEKRIQAQKKFEKGQIRLIIANKVFKKGVDIKRVDVIIDAAGFKNKDDAIQKFGRGVRRHQDKHGLLYFDIADHDPQDDERKAYVQKINKQRIKTKTKKLQFKHQNRFYKAALDRKKAFKAAGLQTQDFYWEKDGKAKKAFQVAKKALEKLSEEIPTSHSHSHHPG